MKAAGPLQKLLHLANGREALAAGDLQQALNEADAAIDADATFAAAQTLRAQIVARMDAVIAPEHIVSIPAAAPVAVAVAVTAAPEPVASPPIAVPVVVVAPPVVPKAPSSRRSHASKRTGLVITLGTLVVVGGVGVALLATGILGREPSVRPVAVRPATPPPAAQSDVALPTPVRPSAAAASVTTAVAESHPSAAEPVSTLWASPRLAQLSVRPRWRASALHVDDNALLRDLGQGMGELWIGKLTGNEDVVFVGGSIDEGDWMNLRASIKPTGVVWRIYSNRSSSPGETAVSGAVRAGFSRVKRVRYSADYSGEQYALRRAIR